MELKQILEWLKATLESNFTAAVVSLKQHIPTVRLQSNKVEVTNPVKEVKISNPSKDYSKELSLLKEEFNKSLEKLNRTVLSIKPSNSVLVNNLKDFPKIPEFPKEIKVTNPQEKVEVIGLNEITKAINIVKKAIDKLPTSIPEDKESVTVKNLTDLKSSFKEIVTAIENIKTPTFKVPDLKGIDPTKYVPVRLSDGKKFYQAIEDFTIAAGRTYSFSDSSGTKQQALVDAQRHLQVDVVSNPLPTGASTSAKQDTQTTLLQGIAGMIPSAYDSVVINYSDSTKVTVSSYIFKLGATTVATITPTEGSTSTTYTKT